jgi:hypothetical protein
VNTAAQSGVPGDGVVADYVANRLSERDAQAFELYCLDHPDFAQHVERELALKTGLRQAPVAAAQVGASTSKKRSSGRWPFALAASVVFVGAVVVYQYASHRIPALVAATSVGDLPDKLRRAALSEVRLARMRGQGAATQVSISASNVVKFQVIPDMTSEAGVYWVRISGEAPSSIKPLTVRGLRPTTDGFLQVYVPAAPMIGRTWVVSVGDDADAEKGRGEESFRVEFVTEAATSH